MTEEEAKTKWCPAYRVTNASGYTIDNRASNDPPAAFDRYHCIGSACMAWRMTEAQTGPRVTLVARPDPNDENNTIVKSAQKPAMAGSGYCGLAGKP